MCPRGINVFNIEENNLLHQKVGWADKPNALFMLMDVGLISRNLRA
jgi:hypothetical protein